MPSLYIQKNSPYYWIRVYDKNEPVRRKRRKSFNSKIPITEADKRAYAAGKGINGNNETKELLKRITAASVENNIEQALGLILKPKILLSEGLSRFFDKRALPGDPNALKYKTKEAYKSAVGHLIAAVGDLYVHEYTEDDFDEFIKYLHSRGRAQNTISIYARSLKALWHFFKEKDFTDKNVIRSIRESRANPDPIPLSDLIRILNQIKLNKKFPHQYQIVYFMLLTGCRPSSAVVQLREDIDQLSDGFMEIQDVKTGDLKQNPRYIFPIYDELKNLLEQIGFKRGQTGRLFPQYKYSEKGYVEGLTFWERAIKELTDNKTPEEERISRRYVMKQLRPTFASYAVNVLNLDIVLVQRLLNHANIKVTGKHYLKVDLQPAKESLNKANFIKNV